MPELLSTCVAACLVLMFGWQCYVVLYGVRRLRRPLSPLIEDHEAPRVLVVLCLRGGDPFLSRSLKLLINQDYPEFLLRIVVDSAADNAHRYLREAFGETPPAHVEICIAEDHHPTCSYKMSAILHGTKSLPEGTALVAFMDGDTVPHSTWLRELATPIVRDGAGVSMGNRWYVPQTPSLGTMCRFLWNCSAVPVMTLLDIPWGGTMAVRADLIQDEECRRRIRHAYGEDTTIGQFAKDRGEQIAFPPTLLILNQEDISVRQFFTFDLRQLVAVRVSHRGWPLLATFGLTSTFVMSYPVWRIFGLNVAWWVDVLFVFGFLLTRWAGAGLGTAVRSVFATRGEKINVWSQPRSLQFAVLSGLLIAPLHFIAVLRAWTLRHISWRGVHYRIGGNPPVQVERDDWVTDHRTKHAPA
ncbi:MAG: glycosyltransferase family 2 protein [Planctomycetaceae bacterium]